MTTINDLKNALGKGMGSKTNKYLIELNYNNLDSKKFNILCKNMSFPQRTIDIASVSHHGRKYNIRSETNFNDTLDITIIDDDLLTIRKFFDAWLTKIDNAKNYSSSVENGSLGTNYGVLGDFFQKIQDTTQIIQENVEDIKNFDNILKSEFKDYFYGLTGFNSNKSLADYQTSFNIWQLSNTGEKVYGYRINNAFPSSIGAVQYDDSSVDSLVEYPITFTFSTFDPISPQDI